MARGRQVSRVPVRGPRRLTTWGLLSSTAFTAVPAASKLFLGSLSAATLSENPRSTLVRIRGVLAIRSDQQAAIEQAQGAFGIAVVRDTARAIGVTALPGPITDGSGDYWQTWMGLIAPTHTPSIANGGGGGTIRLQIDSKGQRKLADLDALVFMVENSHATHGFEVAVQLRILLLLS